MTPQYGNCKICAAWHWFKGHEAMGQCRRHPSWHDTHEGHGCWDFIERPRSAEMSVIDDDDIYFLISNTRAGVAKRIYRDQPNWVLVKDMFGCGSTKAHQICAQGKIDPEALIARHIIAGEAK